MIGDIKTGSLTKCEVMTQRSNKLGYVFIKEITIESLDNNDDEHKCSENDIGYKWQSFVKVDHSARATRRMKSGDENGGPSIPRVVLELKVRRLLRQVSLLARPPPPK